MTERDRFASRHMGLVHAICKRFSGRGVEFEELFAAGCLGLTKAMDGFDSSRGLQFSTYAFPVITGEVKRLFRDGGAVRVSRSLRELSLKIARLNRESMQQRGVELTPGALAERLSVTPEQIVEAIGSARAPLSLTASDDGEPQLELPTPDIQEALTERLSLQAALNTLQERDRRLIALRYYQGQTQTQTARFLGMTQVQVSRREKKLLAQLRALIG
ncbi:MAG: sigma-70 family RNA polymerase sigma factor [Ruminococcus sp.]|nr:sigma-70 family RNA polymerase sigma factor [Ruminococcus sp.]